MDTVTPHDITRRMHCFAAAVKETRTHAAERSAFGRYRAGAPYFAQYPLRRLINSGGNNAPLTPELHQEFGRISAELFALEKECGRAYREELFRDLSVYTEAYRTLLCYHELGLCSSDVIAHDPLRDEIGVLLAELDGEFPIDDIRALIASFDETFCLLRQSSATGIPGSDPAGTVTGNATIPLWECPGCSCRPQERTGPH